jgi:hypothetical protein
MRAPIVDRAIYQLEDLSAQQGGVALIGRKVVHVAGRTRP